MPKKSFIEPDGTSYTQQDLNLSKPSASSEVFNIYSKQDPDIEVEYHKFYNGVIYQGFLIDANQSDVIYPIYKFEYLEVDDGVLNAEAVETKIHKFTKEVYLDQSAVYLMREIFPNVKHAKIYSHKIKWYLYIWNIIKLFFKEKDFYGNKFDVKKKDYR